MSKIIALAIASVFAAQAAMAATVTTSVVSAAPPGSTNSIGRPATAVGVPPNVSIHEFVVTTDADILQIDQVVFTVLYGGSLYEVQPASGGSNTERPNPLFEIIIPQLSADTWITTPGPTSIAGNTLDPFGTTNNAWFDTTHDGPQSNFMFARLSLTDGPSTEARFSGRIVVAGAEGPENFPFHFTINLSPEPSSLVLGAMGLIGMLAARRRPAWKR